MAKIILDPEQITIKHPRFPELEVYCLEQEPVEAMDLFSSLAKYQRVVAVTNPATGEILRDNKDNVITVTLTTLPASEIINILSQVVVGWKGLEDSKGVVIPFSKENLKHLFNRGLNVSTTKKDNSGKDVKGTQSFADYIQEDLNKRIEEILEEDKDPKQKASPKRA